MNPPLLALALFMPAVPSFAQTFELGGDEEIATVQPGALGPQRPAQDGGRRDAPSGADKVLSCIAADATRQGLDASAYNLARCLFQCPNPGGAEACGAVPRGVSNKTTAGEFSHPPIKLSCMVMHSNDAKAIKTELSIGSRIKNAHCKAEWGFLARALLNRSRQSKESEALARTGLFISRAVDLKDQATAETAVQSLRSPDPEVRLEALYQLNSQFGIRFAPLDILVSLMSDQSATEGSKWMDQFLWKSNPPKHRISALATVAVFNKVHSEAQGDWAAALARLTDLLGRVARPDDPLLAGPQGAPLPDEIRLEALETLSWLVSDSPKGFSLFPRALTDPRRLGLTAFLMRQNADANPQFVKKAQGIYGTILQLDAALRQPRKLADGTPTTLESNLRNSMIGQIDDLRKKGVDVSGFPINCYFGPRL